MNLKIVILIIQNLNNKYYNTSELFRLFYIKNKKLHILFIGDIMNEKGKSLWIDTVQLPSFSSLDRYEILPDKLFSLF